MAPAATITVDGTLQPDGVTLQLEKKVELPPGPVTVELRPASPRSGPTMLEVLDRIHRDQLRRGRAPLTEEEMAREIEQLRCEDDEYEKRWRETWSQPGTSADGTEGTDARVSG